MSKMVIVIEVDEPREPNFERSGEILDEVRGIFSEQPGVAVHMGIREVADQVLAIFKDD